MKLDKITKTTQTGKKRKGRGYGSGKGGHTSGRGAKGQKARSKVPLYFEGAPMRKSLIRRMPMLRGKLRFKSFQDKSMILNLKHLNLFKKDATVTIDSLIKIGLLPKEAAAKGQRIKILGDGKLEKALQVSVPTSKSAAKAIVKAGGKIVEVKETKKPSKSKKATKKTLKKVTKKVAKKPKTKTKSK